MEKMPGQVPQPHHREGIQNELGKAYDETPRDNTYTAESTRAGISMPKQETTEIDAIRAKISVVTKQGEALSPSEVLKSQKPHEARANYVSEFPEDFSIPKKLIYFFIKGYWPSRKKEDNMWDGGI